MNSLQMNKINLSSIRKYLIFIVFIVSMAILINLVMTHFHSANRKPISLEEIESQSIEIKECLLRVLKENKAESLIYNGNSHLIMSDLGYCKLVNLHSPPADNSFANSQEELLLKHVGSK